MIKHFLSALFFFSLGLILFVNLFQFAGAYLPFDTAFADIEFNDDSVFGFTSIFNFVSTIGSNQSITDSLNAIKGGFAIINHFSIDTFVDLFERMNSSSSSNNLFVVLTVVIFILQTLLNLIVLPLAALLGLAIILIGIIVFIWNLLSIFFKFLLGYYNYVPIHSCLLTDSGCLSESVSNTIQFLKVTIPVVI